MKKLLFLVGTRPEVIKVAPVLRECKKRKDLFPFLCASGQQDALLKDTLAFFHITPDRAFTVWGDLTGKTGECLTRFDEVLKETSPDAVLVQGDTLTAFAGGLAAFHRHIPVFHIEAGLRTRNAFSPFPEELYRRAIDHLSTLHFAPGDRAAEALRREGITDQSIHTVGNTVIDGLYEEIDERFSHPLLKEGKKLLLLTLHRRESMGTPLCSMLSGVASGLKARTDTVLFFPMHPNPTVRKAAKEALGELSAVTLSDPVDTHTFRNLLAQATLVLTDSGGVSEEATALGTPTLLLRDETEREEGVDVGVLRLIGREKAKIAAAITEHLDHPRPHTPSFVFGDGKASSRIADAIERYFCL